MEDTEAEVKRFERAKEQASAELQQLHDKAMDDVGETNAMIFEIHQMMLEDLDYVESIVNIITTQEVNAEYAVGTTADNFAAMFDNTLMRRSETSFTSAALPCIYASSIAAWKIQRQK